MYSDFGSLILQPARSRLVYEAPWELSQDIEKLFMIWARDFRSQVCLPAPTLCVLQCHLDGKIAKLDGVVLHLAFAEAIPLRWAAVSELKVK